MPSKVEKIVACGDSINAGKMCVIQQMGHAVHVSARPARVEKCKAMLLFITIQNCRRMLYTGMHVVYIAIKACWGTA